MTTLSIKASKWPGRCDARTWPFISGWLCIEEECFRMKKIPSRS
jgi:hypothetical protein